LRLVQSRSDLVDQSKRIAKSRSSSVAVIDIHAE
jgi:hypothetical protein